MEKLHARLTSRYSAYDRWHTHPHREHHHWLVAGFVFIVSILSVSGTQQIALDEGEVLVRSMIVHAAEQCHVTSLGLTPLNDLGTGSYLGEQGGLYPAGSNTIPPAHQNLGIAIANTIEPLGVTGNPDPNGSIVMISVGVSNTRNVFAGQDGSDEGSNRITFSNGFKPRADADAAKNPDLKIVSGAQGSNAIDEWNSPTSPTWGTLNDWLADEQLAPEQVQVAWIYLPDRGQTALFPSDQVDYEAKLKTLIKRAKTEYPNLKIAYLSSRGYGGYSDNTNSNVDIGTEQARAYAYQSGWGVKWVVEDQINGSDASLNPDPDGNPATADGQVPWLAWGPYFWADGLTPRSDGLTWNCSADYIGDGLHPNNTGVKKVADMLLNQMKTDPVAIPWFVSANSGSGGPGSLFFYGNRDGAIEMDRVKISVDAPERPVDVGAEDFTIEFWMKAKANDALGGNPESIGSATCDMNNYDWINGNIIIDRDRYNFGRGYGIVVSRAGPSTGVIGFGVMNDSFDARTLCGGIDVLDDAWHHVAVQRNRTSGEMQIFVDGVLGASATGPAGDLSYPDGATPCGTCCNGGSCSVSDPFLVIGAEKHSVQSNGYQGYMDELRVSNTLRYSGAFTPPTTPFVPDTNTVALYHFDEGSGTTIIDSSGAAGGPSTGVLNVGGSPSGPEWRADTPFSATGGGNVSPNLPTIISQSPGPEGAVTTSPTPTFTFTIEDPDVGQQHGYQIQISRNPEFTDVVRDYTWPGDTVQVKTVTFEVRPEDALTGVPHWWRVRGLDTDGAQSAWSDFQGPPNALTPDFVVDAPPQIVWEVPSVNDTVAGTSANLVVRSDQTATSVEWCPSTAGVCAPSLPMIQQGGGDLWTSIWNTTTSPSGAATICARATNGEGEFQDSCISITVNNGPTSGPVVSWASPTAGETIAGNAALVITGDGNETSVFWCATTATSCAPDHVMAARGTGNMWDASWDTTAFGNGVTTLCGRGTNVGGSATDVCISVTIDNAGGGTPDYVVDELALAAAGTICGGDTVDMSTTILNQGTGDATQSSSAGLFVGATPICQQTTNPLTTTESHTYNCTWTATVGVHTIASHADVGDAVSELDELNNSASTSVTVSDCAPTTTSPPAPTPPPSGTNKADFNCDGVVNSIDLGIQLARYGTYPHHALGTFPDCGAIQVPPAPPSTTPTPSCIPVGSACNVGGNCCLGLFCDLGGSNTCTLP